MAKTVLITGANRGIGLEFARQFAADDWQVLACCRHPQDAIALTALRDQHHNITIYQLDTLDLKQIQELKQQLAGRAIEILINNAGIYGNEAAKLGHLDAEEIVEVFRTNALAPLKISEALLENIGQGQVKLIVTISSAMGSIAENTWGDAYAYRASKAAVNMLMKSLAIDVKEHGIRTLLLHPGWVKTDMGGKDAQITTQESVSGMRNVIANLKATETGVFYGYDGRIIPW